MPGVPGKMLAEQRWHKMQLRVRRPGFDLELSFLLWLVRFVDPTEPSFSIVKWGRGEQTYMDLHYHGNLGLQLLSRALQWLILTWIWELSEQESSEGRGCCSSDDSCCGWAKPLSFTWPQFPT